MCSLLRSLGAGGGPVEVLTAQEEVLEYGGSYEGVEL